MTFGRELDACNVVVADNLHGSVALSPDHVGGDNVIGEPDKLVARSYGHPRFGGAGEDPVLNDPVLPPGFFVHFIGYVRNESGIRPRAGHDVGRRVGAEGNAIDHLWVGLHNGELLLNPDQPRFPPIQRVLDIQAFQPVVKDQSLHNRYAVEEAVDAEDRAHAIILLHLRFRDGHGVGAPGVFLRLDIIRAALFHAGDLHVFGDVAVQLLVENRHPAGRLVYSEAIELIFDHVRSQRPPGILRILIAIQDYMRSWRQRFGLVGRRQKVGLIAQCRNALRDENQIDRPRNVLTGLYNVKGGSLAGFVHQAHPLSVILDPRGNDVAINREVLLDQIVSLPAETVENHNGDTMSDGDLDPFG